VEDLKWTLMKEGGKCWLDFEGSFQHQSLLNMVMSC